MNLVSKSHLRMDADRKGSRSSTNHRFPLQSHHSLEEKIYASPHQCTGEVDNNFALFPRQINARLVSSTVHNGGHMEE